MRPVRPLAPVLVLLLVAATLTPAVPAAQTFQASDTVETTALAVGETESGRLVGVTAGVQATAIRNGSGQVFIETKPLAQTDMQGSARLAARVAASTLGLDWQEYDYMLVFRSGSTVVGGPSAGGVLALAVAVALQDLTAPGAEWAIADDFASTGTINPDGTIGPVGGIPEKAEGAARQGIAHVLYPAGQTLTQDHTGQTVDMKAHCQDLGIRCDAAATLLDLIEAAVGIELERPSTPVPGTADYATLLGPSVREQVQALAAGIDGVDQSGLGAQEADDIAALLEEAAGRLSDAEAALENERYYTAATLSFQGRIFTKQAAGLAEYARAADPGAVVAAHIEACRERIDDVADAYTLEAAHVNALYAIGAAQVRVAQAQGLLAQAEQNLALETGQGWVEAIRDAAFCIERTATVTWWADLRDTFGEGPPVEDAQDVARDVLDRATEIVTYSTAVLQGRSDLGRAQDTLREAEAHMDAGREPAAIVRAVDAQTRASLQLQTNSGTLSEAVLDAALETASSAIARARQAGIEPMLSVAQVELSSDVEDPALTLENLWTARALALVTLDGATGAPTYHRVPPWPGGSDVENLAVGVFSGAAAAALTVAALGAVAAARRRFD